jgi:DTW domain-containing protein YfiP
MRPLCLRCQRPLPACLCAWVRPTANQLPVLVLQHPREAAQAKGSVRLLGLSLQACTVQVGTEFDPAALAAWLGPPGASLLLYPDAPGAAPRPAGPLPHPARLVLLDGTWRQARGLLRSHPALQALPRWALPDLAPPRYSIRRAQQPGQRSTLEAACAALGLLEGRPAHYLPLLEAFSGWVAEVAARAAAGPPGLNPGAARTAA